VHVIRWKKSPAVMPSIDENSAARLGGIDILPQPRPGGRGGGAGWCGLRRGRSGRGIEPTTHASQQLQGLNRCGDEMNGVGSSRTHHRLPRQDSPHTTVQADADGGPCRPLRHWRRSWEGALIEDPSISKWEMANKWERAAPRSGSETLVFLFRDRKNKKNGMRPGIAPVNNDWTRGIYMYIS
jgi:hypothetical protein